MLCKTALTSRICGHIGVSSTVISSVFSDLNLPSNDTSLVMISLQSLQISVIKSSPCKYLSDYTSFNSNSQTQLKDFSVLGLHSSINKCVLMLYRVLL